MHVWCSKPIWEDDPNCWTTRQMASLLDVTRRVAMCRWSFHSPEDQYWTRKKDNKPKEYPQQRETKTVAKHAMNEVCLLPRPFYSRGRACKLQSRHKHCMKKTFFQKRLRYCGQHARSSCKGFSSQRTAVRLTLHFIYLTYIIHIFFVLYITYIFYTIF